jgi:hypothetical protein
MTVIKHKQLQEIADGLDAMVMAAEDYRADLSKRLEQYQDMADNITPRRQVKWQLELVERLINTLDDDVLEQLMLLVNRIETLDVAERGEFV